jgi:MFS family permease
MGMNYFITLYTGLQPPGPGATDAEKNAFSLPAWKKSLITSILSAGTFFGALIAGDLADWIGRRTTSSSVVLSSSSVSFFKPPQLLLVFWLPAVLLLDLVCQFDSSLVL